MQDRYLKARVPRALYEALLARSGEAGQRLGTYVREVLERDAQAITTGEALTRIEAALAAATTGAAPAQPAVPDHELPRGCRMSNYYDPWGHAFKLFVNRLLLFVFLAVTSSALLWTWLLVSFYGHGWKVIVASAWALPQGEGELHWRLMFWLTVACGTLATVALFAALMRRTKLRRGDRHRRGARVVHADADHDDE